MAVCSAGKQDPLASCTRPALPLSLCQGKERQMAKLTDARLVHYYDTERHQVLCGTRTAEDHSTKHPRGITCSKCIALLRERAGAVASSGA